LPLFSSVTPTPVWFPQIHDSPRPKTLTSFDHPFLVFLHIGKVLTPNATFSWSRDLFPLLPLWWGERSSRIFSRLAFTPPLFSPQVRRMPIVVDAKRNPFFSCIRRPPSPSWRFFYPSWSPSEYLLPPFFLPNMSLGPLSPFFPPDWPYEIVDEGR